VIGCGPLGDLDEARPCSAAGRTVLLRMRDPGAGTTRQNDATGYCPARTYRHLGAPDGEELPAVGDAFECVGAPVGEVEAGPDEDVFDGTGGEHLVWVGERTDPGSDVHGEPGDGVAAEFNLARVYADPGSEIDAGADVNECARTPHGVARTGKTARIPSPVVCTIRPP
jgi:hypothetical protein